MPAPPFDFALLIDQIADAVADKVAARLIQAAVISPAVDDLPESADTKQAAAYLGLAPQTLRTMRLKASGPVYFKHKGAVRYPRDELRAFRATRLRRHTAESKP